MLRGREEIRAAALVALESVASVEDRIYSERLERYDQLPSLNVRLEPAGPAPEFGSAEEDLPPRDMDILVEFRCAITDQLEDELDAGCLEVERAIAGAAGLHALFELLELLSTVYQEDHDMERRLGLAVLRFGGTTEPDLED